jgi:outer membrane murein-binding lipoprotein Lpp
MEGTRTGQRAQQAEDPGVLPPQLARPDPAQPGRGLPLLGGPVSGDTVIQLAGAVQGLIESHRQLEMRVDAMAGMSLADRSAAYDQRVDALALARSEVSALLADSPTLKQNMTLGDRVTAELRYAGFLLGQADAHRA